MCGMRWESKNMIIFLFGWLHNPRLMAAVAVHNQQLWLSGPQLRRKMPLNHYSRRRSHIQAFHWCVHLAPDGTEDPPQAFKPLDVSPLTTISGGILSPRALIQTSTLIDSLDVVFMVARRGQSCYRIVAPDTAITR